MNTSTDIVEMFTQAMLAELRQQLAMATDIETRENIALAIAMIERQNAKLH